MVATEVIAHSAENEEQIVDEHSLLKKKSGNSKTAASMHKGMEPMALIGRTLGEPVIRIVANQALSAAIGRVRSMILKNESVTLRGLGLSCKKLLDVVGGLEKAEIAKVAEICTGQALLVHTGRKSTTKDQLARLDVRLVRGPRFRQVAGRSLYAATSVFQGLQGEHGNSEHLVPVKAVRDLDIRIAEDVEESLVEEALAVLDAVEGPMMTFDQFITWISLLVSPLSTSARESIFTAMGFIPNDAEDRSDDVDREADVDIEAEMVVE